MRLSLYSFFTALAFCLCLAPITPAVAKEYKDIDLIDITKFSLHYKSVDLNNIDTFKDYLHLSDCEVYEAVKNNPFKLQEVQQAVLKDLAQHDLGDTSLYLRLPVIFYIKGYNFETQSFPVIQSNQFSRVNMLQLITPVGPMCENENIGSLKSIPINYIVKLNVPISLYRIPIQRNIAESLSSRLYSATPDGTTRVLYGYVLLKIEPIQPETQKSSIGPDRIMLRGDAEAIDLYIDQDRKILFKRLDYGDGI